MPQSTSQYIYEPYKFLFDTNNTLLALEHTNHSNWHISFDTTAQFCLFLNLYFLCFFFFSRKRRRLLSTIGGLFFNLILFFYYRFTPLHYKQIIIVTGTFLLIRPRSFVCFLTYIFFVFFFFHGNDAGFFRLLGVYFFISFYFLLQIHSTTLQANNEMK